MSKGSRRSARTAAALAVLRADDSPVLRVPAGERNEDGFTVRSVGIGDKVFRCPGCDHEIVSVPHLVAWPEGDPASRRHWHTACWAARSRRAPDVLRGRRAPRH